MNEARTAPTLDGERIRLILSAGRTGTVFLSKLLADLYPQHRVVHEPPTSRRAFMMWNAEASGWLPAGAARRLFSADRSRVLARLADGQLLVEINPFLHPFAPELHELIRPLHLVHMVRDARDWITSMANFKAAGWRRYVIDVVPFARTVHPLARAEWRTLDTIQRFAWRWRLANEQLRACAGHADHYRLVRYEDLFSGDGSRAQAALHDVLSILPTPPVVPPPAPPWTTRVNPGRSGRTARWQQWPRPTRDRVMEICGPLLESFGYLRDGPGRSG